MTVTKDHGGKRKPSWESKISVCTGSTRSTRVVGKSDRSDTPSSILSSDSDIRFTRKLGGQYRCGCCIIAGFLLFLLIAAVAVYVAHTFILSRPPNERVFRVQFEVTSGDTYTSDLSNPANEAFRRRARSYRERLNLAFRRSILRNAFLKTDILALDGGDERPGLVVHFSVHLDGRRMAVTTEDIVEVLSHEITTPETSRLQNLTIPLESLLVRENSMELSSSLSTARTTESTPTSSFAPRVCRPVELSYCHILGYNLTSYPNLFGHWNYREVLDNVIPFRELIDAECSIHAVHFVCHILQPPCKNTQFVLPCRSYCYDFMRSCGSRLSDRLKRFLDCSAFPELSNSDYCVPRPKCVEDLTSSGLDSRVCDGELDCMDTSDERHCDYCKVNQVHCGVGKSCVDVKKLCDGDMDCPDGSDERNCLTLLPDNKGESEKAISSHSTRLHMTGYVFGQENGIFRKVCVDSFNTSINGLENNEVSLLLRNLAEKVCQSSTFENMSDYTVVNDTSSSNTYIEVEDLEARRPLFLSTSCSNRQILRVACKGFECGRQILRGSSGISGLPKKAYHGDWPWHVPLFKDGVHLCDGTLIAPDWVITTASCFQGQGKAEWIAKLGSVVRLESSTPWLQERLVVGMVKSPVEGSSLVLLNLNEPVTPSDFVRPICLHSLKDAVTNFTVCNTLGWSTTRSYLQRIDVKLIGMGECENMSITNQNNICSDSPRDNSDCSDEEFAGSPLLCYDSKDRRWTLVGVSNWRIGCQQPGSERPRMFDKIGTNYEWIMKMTIDSDWS